MSPDMFTRDPAAAMAGKGSVEIREDVESLTEWALIRTEATPTPGTLFDGPYVGDEAGAREWAKRRLRGWNAHSRAMVRLEQRQVMRTGWRAP